MRLLFPLLVCLAVGATPAQAQRFVIPLAEDTLLYVVNRGATRIFVDLNGARFKLVADASEVSRSQNAYPIPREGSVTMDISAYMRPGLDANVIEFIPQGPPASGIDIVLAPVFVEGQTLAYRIDGLRALPDAFRLAVGPNPSRGPLAVRFTVPAERTAGAPLRLTVLDVQGRLVTMLVDEVRFPGAFVETWHPPDASGVYLFRLESDTDATTVPVTVIR